jgi:hypothetical protein
VISPIGAERRVGSWTTRAKTGIHSRCAAPRGSRQPRLFGRREARARVSFISDFRLSIHVLQVHEPGGDGDRRHPRFADGSPSTCSGARVMHGEEMNAPALRNRRSAALSTLRSAEQNVPARNLTHISQPTNDLLLKGRLEHNCCLDSHHSAEVLESLLAASCGAQRPHRRCTRTADSLG